MPSRRHPVSTLYCRSASGSHGKQGNWKGGIVSADSSIKKNEMTLQQPHRGMVAVAGPAAGDSYPCEGSDEEGGWGGNTGYAIQDAAQALLGASSAANKYHNSNTNKRGGSAEQRDNNRKGHEVDADLPRWKGVGTIWTSTKRLVNSYASALSKQQRERARRMSNSSAINLLADTAESDEVEDGNSCGGPNDVLPRPRSSTAVGRRFSTGGRHGGSSAAELSIELADMMESGKGDDRVDAGELVGGGDAVAVMPDKVAGGERGSMVTRTLRRGGRARNTTGNLVRLLKDEEQQLAGEDSAQEDKKGGRFRSAKRPLPGGGGVSARSSVEEWRPDDWTDRSFKVLGVEIGHMSESGVAAVLVSGIFGFLLVYGYMQEYLVVEVFNRELGLFLTLLQFFGYAAYAASARALHNEHKRKVPMKTYFRLGFLQACMQGMTNVSMMYLNYPAKVLFKSSRMVPIMCFGVIWQGRKYSWRDYVVVFLIVTGLATFMNAETRASEDSATPFSLIGVAFISLALVIDAALINIQEELMNKYDSCQDELIMYSYLCGTVFVASFCLFTGDLHKGVVFLHHQGMHAVMAVMLYAGSGFLGVSCVAALTKRFGALHSAITTTARKAVTLLLSFVVFPNKPFSPQHGVGAVVFILGLVTKASGKKSKSKVPTGQSASTSPGATPFIQMTSRKHLPSARELVVFDTSSTTPLLSDGSGGGGSCNGSGGGSHGANGSGGDVDRTHSPSPANPEGSGAIAENAGDYFVRHRGTPKSTLNGGVVLGGGVEDAREEHGSGRRDRYGMRRQRAAEGMTEPKLSRSPRRRSGHVSPPVTGLGMRS